MPTSTFVKLLSIASWAVIGFIAYATLTQAEFVYAIYYKLAPLLLRPDMQTYAHIEHFVAFAVFGTLFCLAYPQRLFLVCCIVIGSAMLLELLQTLTPDRHGTLVDALEKMAGGAVGIIFARIVLGIFQKRREQAH